MTLTAQQLSTRAQYCGCSDIPAVLGLSPFRSSYALALEKRGLVAPVQDEEEDDRMQAGRHFEAGILAWAGERYGLDIRPCEMELVHPRHDFIRGHVDGGIFQDGKLVGIAEAKNVALDRQNLWANGIPVYIESQALGYATIADLPVVVFPCFGGNDLRRFDVERDPVAEADQIEAVALWWRNIHEDRFPEPDGHPTTTEALKRRFSRSSLEMFDGDDRLQGLAVERVRLHEAMKAAERAREEIDNCFRELIADRAGFTLPDGGKVTWIQCRDKTSLDIEFLEREFPEQHRASLRTKPGHRTLLVKPTTGR